MSPPIAPTTLIGETYLECEPEDYDANEAEEVPVVMGYKKQTTMGGDPIPQQSIYDLIKERWERFKSNPLYNVLIGVIIAYLLIKVSKYVWDLNIEMKEK